LSVQNENGFQCADCDILTPETHDGTRDKAGSSIVPVVVLLTQVGDCGAGERECTAHSSCGGWLC
jgi:hypothetical protein